MRKSFTMLEIVFVLVISGLIAVSGSMAINQIMQNYALQKEYSKLQLDSSSTINQLTKYLQNSIWDSIVIKQNNNYTPIYSINLADKGIVKNNRELVFIEKNSDIINGYFSSYLGKSMNIPYFSGFIDLANSKNNTITTLFQSDKLIGLNTLINNIALYFPFVNNSGNSVENFYDSDELKRKALFKIVNITNNTEMQLSHNPKQIGDVAVIVNLNPSTINVDANNHLVLTKNNVKIILAENVTGLSIWSEHQAGLLRIRLCFKNKTMKFMNEFCKEGVITR